MDAGHPPYYCDQCGTRYFGPGVCSNQHPPADLKRDISVPLPTDSPAGEAPPEASSPSEAPPEPAGSPLGMTAAAGSPTEQPPATGPVAAADFAARLESLRADLHARVESFVDSLHGLF